MNKALKKTQHKSIFDPALFRVRLRLGKEYLNCRQFRIICGLFEKNYSKS